MRDVYIPFYENLPLKEERGMDNMTITSKLMTKLVGKLLHRTIKKKLGYNVQIKLNELNATVIDGTAHVHLNIDAELPKEELNKIVAEVGL